MTTPTQQPGASERPARASRASVSLMKPAQLVSRGHRGGEHTSVRRQWLHSRPRGHRSRRTRTEDLAVWPPLSDKYYGVGGGNGRNRLLVKGPCDITAGCHAAMVAATTRAPAGLTPTVPLSDRPAPGIRWPARRSTRRRLTASHGTVRAQAVQEESMLRDCPVRRRARQEGVWGPACWGAWQATWTLTFAVGRLGASSLGSRLEKIIKTVDPVRPQERTPSAVRTHGQQGSASPRGGGGGGGPA